MFDGIELRWSNFAPPETAAYAALPGLLLLRRSYDQVDQLVGAGEADADTGFMARLMARCGLPRSNLGNRAIM